MIATSRRVLIDGPVENKSFIGVPLYIGLISRVFLRRNPTGTALGYANPSYTRRLNLRCEWMI